MEFLSSEKFINAITSLQAQTFISVSLSYFFIAYKFFAKQAYRYKYNRNH